MEDGTQKKSLGCRESSEAENENETRTGTRIGRSLPLFTREERRKIAFPSSCPRKGVIKTVETMERQFS